MVPGDCALPLRFAKTAWTRMTGDAARSGWAFCIAADSPDGDVALFDPATRGTKTEDAIWRDGSDPLMKLTKEGLRLLPRGHALNRGFGVLLRAFALSER